jgi:phosphoenolpyruvate synthase/pyruvate phosphate dikinase
MEEKDKCPICNGQKKEKNKYCSLSCKNRASKGILKRSKHSKENLAKLMTEKYLKLNGEVKNFKVSCHKCEKEFEVMEPCLKFPIKEKYYCSRQCANSRENKEYTQTPQFRKLMSQIATKAWNDPKYAAAVMNGSVFSSKGERLLRKHFQDKYPDDQWTYGGPVKHKDKRMVRDMYSNKLKICLEYDGIWHFKDINGQLADKQLKDVLLEEWCIENNYRLIRIRDEIFLSDINKYLKIVEDCIYNSTQQIVKIFDLNLIEDKKKRNYIVRNNANEKAS